jgi:hypothetical protein
VGEDSLPPSPSPSAFLPLLPAAIKSASLHFLRAARTLSFNLMRVARGQWPPATGFSPGRPESTFFILALPYGQDQNLIYKCGARTG